MQSPFAAFLRVYEPLAAFDQDRADFWRAYVEQERAVPVEHGPGIQRQLFYESISANWDALPAVSDEAYVIDGDDGPLICPWQLRPRMADAVGDVKDVVPERLVSSFVPPQLVTAASHVPPGDDARGSPITGPFWHERAALWHVPMPWFACLDQSERELRVTDTERVLRYRLPMPRARRRARHAYGILQTSMGRTHNLAISVRMLTEWLAVFHPRSVVEIDYGGLTAALSDSEMKGDDSPRVAHEGLSALARGDMQAAGRSYETLSGRWRAIRLRERRN